MYMTLYAHRISLVQNIYIYHIHNTSIRPTSKPDKTLKHIINMVSIFSDNVTNQQSLMMPALAVVKFDCMPIDPVYL